MIGILLGITIPITYIILGSAVVFRIFEAKIDKDCRGRKRHDSYCDCSMYGFIGGFFWPVTPLLLIGRRIGSGEPIFKFRVHRAERVAKRISEMEKEVFGA